MTDPKTVAVYCGSNIGQGDAYLAGAASLGTALANRGMQIVYGGTNKGLMGALADAALTGGAKVSGIITERLKAKGHTNPALTRVEVLPSMQMRKRRMIELADMFIALPGGIGTLEEFMEVWTLNQLGEIRKPAGLFNINGYYQPLMGMIDHMIAERFLPAEHRASIVVEANPEALLDGLISFKPVNVSKWMS